MPFALIPFLLLAVPVIEITAFIIIGGQIGVWSTLLMILVTAVIGTILLRFQGLAVLGNIQKEMAGGRVPGRALGDGAMILVAGILLLTPGFVSDGLGFLLFVPFVRNAIWNFLGSRISVAMPSAAEFATRSFTEAREAPSGSGPIIDLDEDEYHTGNSGSPWKNRS